MTISKPKTETKNKTILVVEDSDDLRSDVLEMLKLEGYTTHGAENGVIGVDQARKLMPDLIVCDIMMPELNGYGVLQTLRADAGTAAIPFIFLTAKTEHIDQRHGMVLGADDFLTKPFMAEELLEAIEAQLKKREEQLFAVKQRIDDLTSSITLALPHEFRTPLNTVIGFSEMLQSEAQNLKPDQVAGWAGHIHKAGYRLYRVVENYLLYARLRVELEENKSYDSAVVEDMNVIIQSQAMSVANTYKRVDDMVLDIEKAPPLQMEEEHATKIVEELLDNAFKFSKSGSAINVKASLEGESYVVVVEDKGRGMSQNQVSGINAFMQFERDYHEQQGLGLGLALVKQITNLYKIVPDISGEKDKGIKATIRFKLK